MWDIILSIVVGIHMIVEFSNYIYNYFVNKKEKNLLEEVKTELTPIVSHWGFLMTRMPPDKKGGDNRGGR